MAWLKARLGEHSTQIALGAVISGVGAALSGSITWQQFWPAAIGALVPLLTPNTP